MTHRITIAGIGAVSSAGWGVEALWRAVTRGLPPALAEAGILPYLSGDPALARAVRRVPKPDPRPAFLAHPRLRRASAISHFAAAAALEAIGPERLEAIRSGGLRTGIVCSLLNGSVNYSARFHAEVLKDPATASPMLFPETVFNAPASHVAALLGITAPITTVLGDTAQFFPAVETAVQWLLDGLVDTCLVIGAEEADWLTAEALALLAPDAVLSEGAGALLLEKNGPGPLLSAIYGPHPILQSGRKGAAAALFADIAAAWPPAAVALALATVAEAGAEMKAGAAAVTKEGQGQDQEQGQGPGAPRPLLITDRCGDAKTDAPTESATASWPGPALHPRTMLGEALGASAALQSVLAVRSLADGGSTHASAVAVAAAVGGNMQAAALEVRAGLQ